MRTRLGSAAPAGQSACLASSTLPGSLASRPDSDCFSGVVTTASGAVIAGTVQGKVIVEAGAAAQEFLLPGTPGAISDLTAFSVTRDATRQFVAFSTNQGVGVVDPNSGSAVMFGPTRPLIGRNAQPISDIGPFITAAEFIKMRPTEGRPHLNALGQYALTKPDGADEVLTVSGGESQICAIYIPAPGFTPERSWCADVSDLVPRATAQPVLPVTGGGCSEQTDVVLDPAHTINITVDRFGFTPNDITVRGGEAYVVRVSSADPGVLHSFSVVDADGHVIRDLNGSLVCLAATVGSPVAGQFVAPKADGTAYLIDPLRPSIRAVIRDVAPTPISTSTVTAPTATHTAAAPAATSSVTESKTSIAVTTTAPQ